MYHSPFWLVLCLALLSAGCGMQAQRQFQAIETGSEADVALRCGGGSGSSGGGPGMPTVVHCDHGMTWQSAPEPIQQAARPI
jgi:hypothetical protein